jgi:hypothetical protein
MATSTPGGYRRCPNGHAVLSGDRFCTTCGAAVAIRRAKPAAEAKPSSPGKPAGLATPTSPAKPAVEAKPASPAKPAVEAKPAIAARPNAGGKTSEARSAATLDATREGATPVAATREEPPPGFASEPDARLWNPRRRGGSFGATTWIAAAMIVATVVVGAVVAVKLLGGNSSDAEGPGGRSGFATACDGIAHQEITIGQDATTRNGLLCFRVTERSEITITATPNGTDADLQLTVSLGTGRVLTENDDADGLDPEVIFEAQPGTYILSVTRWGGGNPGEITVHSSAVVLPETGVSAIPTLDECANLSGPTIQQSGAALRAAGEPFTCLSLTTGAFTKIGARANDPAATDLTLAVYFFDGAGVAQFVRSVDDTFATDPELNLDLAAGNYLIEVSAYDAGPMGAYSVYVDTTGTFIRTGPVSSGLATLRPSDCASLPAVTMGAPLTTDVAGEPLACVTLDSPRRIVVMAETLAGQDLTLEIVGFDSTGSPVRYVWADEDVFGEDPNSQDPRVDLVLPAGTYVLAINEYWGAEVAHDFVVTVTPRAGPTG